MTYEDYQTVDKHCLHHANNKAKSVKKRSSLGFYQKYADQIQNQDIMAVQTNRNSFIDVLINENDQDFESDTG